jgi:hypothetical protein
MVGALVSIPGELGVRRSGADIEIDTKSTSLAVPARQTGLDAIHKWVFSET